MLRLKVVFTAVLFAAGGLEAVSYGIVSGFVREKSSGEFMSYVSVYIENQPLGSSTSKDGYYVISAIPPGKYTLVCSMIGFKEERFEIEIEAGKKLRHDFFLEEEALKLGTVEITAERERFEHEVDIGVKRMDMERIKQVPGFVEQDLFRSLTMLPGVVSISDYSSALYIRGGTMDQNLILLDGVTVYNPYHLLGFYSTFILEALKGAELYTGGYPARYGGAISSVLDVEMKAGNSEKITGYADVGLLTSKAVVEGPLPFGLKGSWLVAGRRTYIDAVTWTLDKMFIPETSYMHIYVPYHFYDLQAKLNWDASDRSRFTISGFFGDDVLNLEEMTSQDIDFRWGNGVLGLRWRYVFTPQLFSVLSFNASRYRVKTTMVEDTTYSFILNTSIGEIGGRWGLEWFPAPEHSLEFGIETKAVETANLLEDQDTTWVNKRDTFLLSAIYIQDKWEPLPWWVFEAGLRGEYFSNGNYLRVNPRLGVKYRPLADLALKAGAGLYDQYLYVPYPRDEMMLKLPLQFFQQWIPSDEWHPPLHSTLFTLGAEYKFPKNVDISIEGYYKDMRNIREADMFSDIGPFADTSGMDTGRGYSYGAELLVKYRSSWIGYSYSVTKYKFGDSDWFYPVHDSRHNLNLSFSLPLGKGWDITSAWVFSSGFPFTGQIGWYQYVDPNGNIRWEPITGRRGGVRYPPYHRLDAGFAKSFKLFKKFDCQFYLQVLNVYAAKNVLYYDYYFDYQTGITHRDPFYMLPFPVPSFGIRGTF